MGKKNCFKRLDTLKYFKIFVKYVIEFLKYFKSSYTNMKPFLIKIRGLEKRTYFSQLIIYSKIVT